MSTPAAPRAVVFDWDNTLVDTWPVILGAFNATLDAMGHPIWTMEEARVRIGRSLRDAFPQLFGDSWEDARRVFYENFTAVHLNLLAALDGAETVLGAVHALGLPSAVVSNKTGKYLRAEIAHLGWTDRFGAAIGAGDAARDKPWPDPLLLALAHLDLRPGRDIWYVGDSSVDIECAARAGCTSVLVEPVSGPTGEPGGRPDLEFASLSELAARLGQTLSR